MSTYVAENQLFHLLSNLNRSNYFSKKLQEEKGAQPPTSRSNLNFTTELAFTSRAGSTSRVTAYLLSLVPHSHIAQILLWTSGEMELEGESEHVINTAEEVQATLHLRLNLDGNKRQNNLN